MIKREELDRWKQLAEAGPLQITTSSRGYFLRTEEQYVATLEYGPDKEKTLNDALGAQSTCETIHFVKQIQHSINL